MYRLLRAPTRRRTRGQALAEFAIVFPIMFLIVAAIIQFGIFFWAQNTLNQVARDTGRWAATQKTCTDATAVVNRANTIAAQSTLIGYTAGSWSGANVSVTWPPNTDPGHTTDPCPPTNNGEVRWIHISITHNIPVFFGFVPGVSGTLSTSTDFRMEPAP
jgi:Flp pilus assembly protein TadG